MRPDTILAQPAIRLSLEQRRFYFVQGYLHLPGFLDRAWLAKLTTLMAAFVDESRGWSRSDTKFDLEAGHSAETPRLRRLCQPVVHHPLFWELTSNSPITDIAQDLLGPDVKFHHSKLNFKWSAGGQEVKWHQDFPFWPHTNDSVLTIGVYLENVDETMGPMGVVPGSHRGELFSQYDERHVWAGAIGPSDIARAGIERTVYLQGPAGSVTVHHCRTIHGSKPNRHATRSRPLLLQSYSSADALPVTPYVMPCRHDGAVVRGASARLIEFDGGKTEAPPDWSRGYSSIFALQEGAEKAEAYRG
ncbi:MAG: phytanoyl-CoA dioxygenase family protein [Alphaproteobacteria bacterium]|nr:phytanoyl-CoA dioxygenase family protein [Alphaproteobacteria bacterium]